MKSEVFNMDCIDYMRKCSNKQFDLAIVDPPYGVEDMTGKNFAHGGGKLKNRILNKKADDVTRWDKPPKPEYWKELFRISKYQIIWGGNYFDLPPYRCPIVWDKVQPFKTFQLLKLLGLTLMNLQNCFGLIIDIQGRYTLLKNLLNYINGF